MRGRAVPDKAKPPAVGQAAPDALYGALCDTDGSTVGDTDAGVATAVARASEARGATAVGACAVVNDPPRLTGGVKSENETVKVLRVALDFLTEHATGRCPDEQWADMLRAASADEPWDGLKVERIRGRFPLLVHGAAGIALRLGSRACVLEIKGEALTTYGGKQAYEMGCRLRDAVGSYAPSGYPARVDVAVDMALTQRPKLCKWTTGRKGAVPKPSVWQLNPDDTTYGTQTLGKMGKDGCGLQIQLYDKLADLTEREHRTAYREALQQDYSLGGWDGSGYVYRWEARANRQRCEENGLRIATLLDNPATLIGLALGWLQPSGCSTTSAVWQALGLTAAYTAPAPRMARLSKRLPDDLRLVDDYVRTLARYMAAHGVEDADTAAQRLHFGMMCREANDALLTERLDQYRKQYSGLTAYAPDDDLPY